SLTQVLSSGCGSLRYRHLGGSGDTVGSREHFLDDRVYVLLRRAVIRDAGAEPDGTLNARVREPDATCPRGFPKNLFVSVVQLVGVCVRPAEADGAQLDGGEQFQRRFGVDQLGE